MKKIISDYKLNISLIVAFTATIFAPIELYITNIDDFWFDIYDILPSCLILFAIVFGVNYLLLSVCGKSLYRIISIIELIALYCLYIQGNFMVMHTGVLDGEPVEWEKFYADGIMGVCAWLGIAVLILAFLYKLKYERFIYIVSRINFCLLLVELFTLITISITSHGFISKNDYAATNEGLNTNSEQMNFNIIVLDSFDSRVFNELIEDNPDVANDFDGFTYWRNNIGKFTLTDFGVPQILTGEEYINQCEYGEYVDNAYVKSPLLNRLRNDEWEEYIYTTITLPQNNNVNKALNWEKINYSAESWKLMAKLYRLIEYRYYPQCIKPLFWFDMDEFDELKRVEKINGEDPIENVEPFDWTNTSFADNIGRMNTVNTNKIFHFYHLKGIHAVRDMDENFEETDEELDIYEEGANVLAMIDLYFDKMKELGVYDKSIIVILADHGCAAYDGGKIHSPLLLVKGINEQHDMLIMDTPVSYLGLQEGFDNLLDGKKGYDFFEGPTYDYLDADGSLVRKFYYTDFTGQLRKYSHSNPFVEYEVRGGIYDYNLITKSGISY